MDTLGLVLAVIVHSAKIQDRDGAKLLFARAKLKGPWPRMEHVWADGGYAGTLVEWVRALCRGRGTRLEIVKHSKTVHRFKVLPRRWVVERTFAWLGRSRRLSKDYEHSVSSSESFIYIAMIRLMLSRLVR